MKTIKYIIILVIAISTLMSCGKDSGKQPATADGFADIESEIKSEFGHEAYYTDLTITYNKSIGNIISVTVTEDPSSLKMGQWNQTQGIWNQNSEISLEVPQGTKAEDYMFQLDEQINLSTLGELAEKANKKLTEDKKLENPTLSMAFVKFPKNGDVSKTEYTVMLKPEHGGTTFTFRYDLKGDLITMDY
ncbi:hypothetical protein [Winogradskyella psychrotolerans]|uniref:hypothetical protein n=1 Tax=Winogradskyella psychrotolerans TaxID=1344585 RepID=UPI001C072989|nr:hypothetical protein [Winogradskyella psychrotolerans]MBU2930253.1 hypothetical protein [Winogradskyella psychrotolerans]